jgi:hypothetical protein
VINRRAAEKKKLEYKSNGCLYYPQQGALELAFFASFA